MHTRRTSSATADAVARRLELLSAELDVVRGSPAPDLQHTRIRGRPTPVEPAPVVERALVVEPVETSPVVEPVETTSFPRPGRHAARRPRPALPVLLPGLRGRVAITPAHLTVVAVLALIGLALTTWWVVRSDAATVPVTEPGRPLATPVGVVTPSPSAQQELVVHVAGKVRRPGIAVLPPGARVVDALEAAGGARRGVDLAGVNLARVVTDGEQILVGIGPPGGPAAAAVPGPSGPLVNLNTATAADLEALPGVGPVTAESIVRFREEHGAFTAVDELLDVRGIGDATLAEIEPHVTL